jgi:hypothetical protein
MAVTPFSLVGESQMVFLLAPRSINLDAPSTRRRNKARPEYAVIFPYARYVFLKFSMNAKNKHTEVLTHPSHPYLIQSYPSIHPSRAHCNQFAPVLPNPPAPLTLSSSSCTSTTSGV